MVVTLHNFLDLKEKLDKEIQSHLIRLYSSLKFFIYIKLNEIVLVMNTYIYISYADNTTFFLKNQTSVKNALNVIKGPIIWRFSTRVEISTR